MTSREFRGRLEPLLTRTGAQLPSVQQVRALQIYLSLLCKWNARMNLTAFPLDPATDRTFERLLIEPIVAARHVPDRPEVWFDLGSGGGSPAIPIKILRPALLLTMVEAKARKTAFLREVVRTLGLPQVAVENAPFADLASRCPAVAQWVTARGVRIDRAFSTAAAILTALDGRLLLFRSRGPEQVLPEFVLRETVPLLASDGSCLTIYDRV